MVFPLCKSAILPKTDFIFALNYFEFNDESYIQAHATAMRTSTAKHRSSPWELVVDDSKVGQVWVMSDPPDCSSVGPSLTGPQEQWCARLVDEAVASCCRSGPLAAGP